MSTTRELLASAVAQHLAGLRERLHDSVLMDAPRFARSVEAAYRAIWREWFSAPERGRLDIDCAGGRASP